MPVIFSGISIPLVVALVLEGRPVDGSQDDFWHIFRRKREGNLIIIDGGGRVTASARAAVSSADFILVPTIASKPDALSTQKFFKEVVEEVAAIKGGVSGAILFTMLKTGAVFNISGQKQIRELGYPIFDTVLYHRITYQEAISKGISVIEYSPKSKASDEIESLYKELQEVF